MNKPWCGSVRKERKMHWCHKGHIYKSHIWHDRIAARGSYMLKTVSGRTTTTISVFCVIPEWWGSLATHINMPHTCRWSDIIMLRRQSLLRWYLWQQRVWVMIGLLARGRIRIKIRIRNRPGVTFNVSFYHWSNNCRGSECRTFPACTRYLAKRSQDVCFPPPLRW